MKSRDDMSKGSGGDGSSPRSLRGAGAQRQRMTPMAAEPGDYCRRCWGGRGCSQKGWDMFLVDVITGGEKDSASSMNSDDELHQHEL